MAEKKEYKIGIIDDHVQSAISLSNTLEYEGFKTFQAYNGEDAMKISKKENPDIFIMDIRMKDGIDGYTLAKNLDKTKLLFTSGSAVDKKKIVGIKNIIGIVEKPINTDEVLKILRKELKIKVEE